MVSKLFDNLLKTIQAASVFTAGTLVSLEVDFEIPRGFVVKIHSVELRIDRVLEDFEAINADKLARLRIALIKDPDDITTVSFTSNRVQHDVLIDLEVSFGITLGTAESWIFFDNVPTKYRQFSNQGNDVIIARNMRLNIDGEGTDVADLTESFGIAIIDYTLEEVKDEDILNILDIL